MLTTNPLYGAFSGPHSQWKRYVEQKIPDYLVV